MNKSFIYLSYFLDENTPLYGGEKGIKMVADRSISKGDSANTKRVSFHNHSGTHIDFPNHFFDQGKVAQDYDASFWIFNNVHLKLQSVFPDELIKLSEKDKDAFRIMGLELNTDWSIIQKKFKTLVKKFHPDRNAGNKQFEDRLKKITLAYSHLKLIMIRK